MKRLATCLLLAFIGAAHADQNSITLPVTGAEFDARSGTTGQRNFLVAAPTFLNPALKSLASNFSGNGCGGITSPVPWQWCVDTLGRTVSLNTAPLGGSPFSFTPAFTINADGTLSPGATANAYMRGNNPSFTGVMTTVNPGDWYAGNLRDIRFGSAFGMVCDNVTDDGPAFQTAMNSAGGHKLYLPANATCRIKSYVSIPSHTYLYGANSTIQFDPAAAHSGSQDVTMMADGTSIAPITDVVIDGVTFTGPGTASINDRVKIVTNYAQHWVIRNSTFQNFGNTTNSTTRSTTYGHGIQFFNASNVVVDNNTVTNNVGDGISFSNSSSHLRVRNNQVSNNFDSGIVPCTIGGTDTITEGNTVSAPAADTGPVIVLDRCTNAIVSNNKVDGPASSSCIKVERAADDTNFNQDIKIVGNTCTGGSNIVMSALGTTQGSVSVAKGGMFSVINNLVQGSSGQGIYIADSSNGTIIGNRIINASGEGIMEESFSVPVGNNIIEGNIVDGATYCQRQLVSGGSVIASRWFANDVRNCSVARGVFVANNGLGGTVPASASAACVTGEVQVDASFIYSCVGTNTWKRTSVGATW